MILITHAHICDRCHTTVFKTAEEGVARRGGPFGLNPLPGWSWISEYRENKTQILPFVYACPDCVKHHIKIMKQKGE